MEKLAAQAPPPASTQAPPPPPPQAVAMQTVPAGPGEMPAPQKKYKDGPGDVKNAQNSLNNLVYALDRYMQGDTAALRQFQQQKMASIQKQAYDWTGGWQGGPKEWVHKAGEDAKELGSQLASWGKEKAKQALSWAESNYPEQTAKAKDWYIRHNYGDLAADAYNWLNKDSLGLGLKNWHVGAGLLGIGGLYGIYRTFSGSEEEKRRKQEAEEMRKLRMEMAKQNLYRQYQ